MPEVSIPDYKVAFFDIENSPLLTWNWGTREQNAIAIEEDWYLMAASWKWQHESKTRGFILPDYKLYKTEPNNDYELVKTLWGLLNEVDLLIGHNLVEFDVRKVNARIAHHGLPPPSPYKTVDTLKIARKHFMFSSNRLGDLAEYLGVEHLKLDAGSFKKLWLACMNGDMEAWKQMRKYNIRDSVTLEEVYNVLRPWHDTHPNVSLGRGLKHACTVCGSEKYTIKCGPQYLKAWIVERWVCVKKKGGCGKYSRGARIPNPNKKELLT